MSIYSGFATRKQQTSYNKLLMKLIKCLQDNILEILEKCGDNLGFTFKRQNQCLNIIEKLKEYEEHKYLSPNFSEVVDPLSQYLRSKLQNNCYSRMKTEPIYPSISKRLYQSENISVSSIRFINSQSDNVQTSVTQKQPIVSSINLIKMNTLNKNNKKMAQLSKSIQKRKHSQFTKKKQLSQFSHKMINSYNTNKRNNEKVPIRQQPLKWKKNLQKLTIRLNTFNNRENFDRIKQKVLLSNV